MPKTRRDFIKQSITTFGAASAAVASGGASSEKQENQPEGARRPPFRLIFEAEWNDIPCVDYPLTLERWLEECMHPLLDTQVDTLLYNLCSSDGYVAELKTGELLMDSFDKLGDAWVWRYRENTKKLIAADANPRSWLASMAIARG